METEFNTRLLSSLSKVFGKRELKDEAHCAGTALQGEIYSFQLAYYSNKILKKISVEVDSDLKDNIKLREAALAPSDLPCYNFDDNYLSESAGLFPDPLCELSGNSVKAMPFQWRSLWVTVAVPSQCLAGRHGIKISLKSSELEPDCCIEASETFSLDILPVEMPRQKLIHTEWFHTDCIATHYNVEVWSEKHWELVEKYVKNAVDHGINMILTPVFTPPLDTQVGGERPTVQLVDVLKKGNSYSFGFSRLKRWIEMLKRCGAEYFEISHLFTQWGANHAPKIIAEVDGVMKQIFGWDTDAHGEEYKLFLSKFLPELTACLEDANISEKSIFHVSDEPAKDHMESYRRAVETISPYLEGYTVIDALSKVEFYDSGLVKKPVPANNHIEPFMDRNIEGLWTYYCCSQWDKVPNRFFAMPSARNRIMGALLYKYDLSGFLHWGFNFWYSQYSINKIDPFKVTDADKAFPSGDAFLVYPGEDGPVDSIRHEVMREALQDLRALRLLEEKIGRDKVCAILEKGLGYELKMDKYPQDAEWLLNMRENINFALKN